MEKLLYTYFWKTMPAVLHARPVPARITKKIVFVSRQTVSVPPCEAFAQNHAWTRKTRRLYHALMQEIPRSRTLNGFTVVSANGCDALWWSVTSFSAICIKLPQTGRLYFCSIDVKDTSCGLFPEYLDSECSQKEQGFCKKSQFLV